MYSLACDYYDSEFNSITGLLNDILVSGMDPNYEITLDGVGTGTIAWDLLAESI